MRRRVKVVAVVPPDFAQAAIQHLTLMGSREPEHRGALRLDDAGIPFETDHRGHPRQLAANDRAERDAGRDLVVEAHYRRTQTGLDALAHPLDAVRDSRKRDHLEAAYCRQRRELQPRARDHTEAALRADAQPRGVRTA